MNCILFCENPYSFSILNPIKIELIRRNWNYLWYIPEKHLKGFPYKKEGNYTSSIKDLVKFRPDANFVPGNEFPHFISGVKVQIFHGFAGEKKGHFRIRHYFDLYLTQGPWFTHGFELLKNKYKNFEVVETGWPKLDPFLPVHKKRDTDLKSFELTKGMAFVTVQGFLIAMAFILFSEAARQYNPLVVAYFWEVQIGLCLMLIGFLRWGIFKKPLQKVSLSTFGKILLVCSPTLIGTAGFALAVNYGPIGIAGAISVGGIFISALLSLWIYHEKPKSIEWIGMAIIALGILGLKLIEL